MKDLQKYKLAYFNIYSIDCIFLKYGKQLTQLVECFAYNEKVSGSNPLLFIKTTNKVPIV